MIIPCKSLPVRVTDFFEKPMKPRDAVPPTPLRMHARAHMDIHTHMGLHTTSQVYGPLLKTSWWIWGGKPLGTQLHR